MEIRILESVFKVLMWKCMFISKGSALGTAKKFGNQIKRRGEEE